MPIPIATEIYRNGLEAVPFLIPALKFIPWLVVLYIVRLYFDGTQNENERIMHGKVALITVRLPHPLFPSMLMKKNRAALRASAAR